MTIQHTAADLGLKAMNAIHKGMLAMTGGRVGRSFFGMSSVRLYTTGRKSGKRRETMLTAPIQEDGRVVLVASKGGDERQPEWYLNLVANPDVELAIEEQPPSPFHARTATPAERAELWPRITSQYRNYGAYQKRTEREIPVVICEPRR
jgi:deazaflavin-dependent oxidoreductase (nitroreductase family)